MAIDSAAKRATAATVGPPINAPSVIPNAVITSFDRYQIGWSYRIASSGTLMFYGTTLGSGVETYPGVSWDDDGNLYISGTVTEGP
jgi:hypothetical protein